MLFKFSQFLQYLLDNNLKTSDQLADYFAQYHDDAVILSNRCDLFCNFLNSSDESFKAIIELSRHAGWQAHAETIFTIARELKHKQTAGKPYLRYLYQYLNNETGEQGYDQHVEILCELSDRFFFFYTEKQMMLSTSISLLLLM